MVNTFLFELLVVGIVSAGTFFFQRPTSSIFIEIANTTNNDLVGKLPMCVYFMPVFLNWGILFQRREFLFFNFEVFAFLISMIFL
jgi:hypothetical protein